MHHGLHRIKKNGGGEHRQQDALKSLLTKIKGGYIDRQQGDLTSFKNRKKKNWGDRQRDSKVIS
jgi:hypothetical protein